MIRSGSSVVLQQVLVKQDCLVGLILSSVLAAETYCTIGLIIAAENIGRNK